MKYLNYLILLFVIISIAIDLIAADSDIQDSTVKSRSDDRVQNRTDRQHHRKERRESTWTKIKNWLRVGRERRESRRLNRKLNRLDRREEREKRRLERKEKRYEHHDDFFKAQAQEQ